jgi:2-alkenal reductase
LVEGLRLKPPVLIGAFVAVALLSGLASGALVAVLTDDGGNDSPTAEATRSPSPARTLTPEESLSHVAENALSSVVTVVNEGDTRVENGLEVQTVNSGTGVIIDEAGFILTNEHVVHEPGTLSVVLNDGEQRPARLISQDAPFTDLAVLQIPEGNLTAMPIGDSANLHLGQSVLVIGSALYEYDNSVTSGIISGLGRRYLRNGIFMEDLIQTDAAVNTGNSGGPLITSDGRMVGLVSNVVRSVNGIDNVQGIAFAISSRTIAPIVSAILSDGSFPRPYFGVQQLDLDVPTAAQMNLPVSHGALVQSVDAGSPAEQAGIQQGDIILSLGDSEISEDFTYLNSLAIVAPDERIPVEVLRDGQTMQLSVQLVPRE